MRRFYILLLLLSTSIGAQAYESGVTALPSKVLPSELDRVLRDYERAWTAKDTVALSALFATDGIALPNGRPPALGAIQIQSALSTGPGSPLALRALSYSIANNLAYVVGGWTTSPGKPDLGKFVLVLRRDANDRWLIVADIDNLNSRPPAPSTSSPADSTSAPTN